MNYTDTVNAWITLLEEAPSPYTPPTDFATMLPRAIEYAEGRIYARMVWLASRDVISSLTASPGSRTLSISSVSPPLLVVEGVAMITPQGDAPSAGTRYQFDKASLDFIDSAWPQESVTAPPGSTDDRYWAMLDNQTIVYEPTPDSAYTIELTGYVQPAPLSASNTTTYITLTYPQLMIAAGMIFWSGYQRDFGSQSEDPRMAQSWETQYQTLESLAVDEEFRRRGLENTFASQAKGPAQAQSS